MSRVHLSSLFLAVALMAGLVVATPAALAQAVVSAAFTHQGELRSGGVPVEGTKSMKFRLYDAPSSGTQIGLEQIAAVVPLVEGRFAVELNFGASSFTGQARWLEIDVSNGASGAPYTTLSPRQAISATPYALYALNAASEIQCSTDTQFSIDDRSGWTHVEALSDDTCFTNIPLGFTFTGWGRSVTTVSVSSNGVLFFGPNCAIDWTNTALPSNMSQDPLLAFFWDDLLDGGSGEYFEYATTGSPGGRVFHLYFRNRVRGAICPADDVQLMLSIHEGSNLINIVYSGFTGCAPIRGNGATFGLQGPGGANAKAFMVGYNALLMDDNASRQSISFTPPRQ